MSAGTSDFSGRSPLPAPRLRTASWPVPTVRVVGPRGGQPHRSV